LAEPLCPANPKYGKLEGAMFGRRKRDDRENIVGGLIDDSPFCPNEVRENASRHIEDAID
jgi:hypothetical protein